MALIEDPAVIANEVGFYDLPRFDKVFRRIIGTSPSAHRRGAAEAQNGKPPIT